MSSQTIQTGAVSVGTASASTSMLRIAGLRPTFLRLCVLHIMQADPKRWMSTEEVHQELISQNETVCLASTYRAIKDLQSHGILLRELHTGQIGGKFVYVLSPAADTPADDQVISIVCRQCKTGVFIDDPTALAQIQKLSAHQRLTFTNQPITIHVTCEQCAARRRHKTTRERKLVWQDNGHGGPKAPRFQ